MDALHAHSPAEAEYYLKVTPCPGCAKGPWEIQVRRPEQDARSMSARCQNCHIERRFEFFCPEQDPAEANPEGDVINASDEPSRIIDVGQWLSLFFFLIDSAAKSPEKAETRKISFQAAQCLDEALKFYTPPTTTCRCLQPSSWIRRARQCPDGWWVRPATRGSARSI